MTFLAKRLRSVREQTGISLDAIGAQGFVSAPGWKKVENGQRQPSESLIEGLVHWLVSDKHIRVGAAKPLREELLLLKYLENKSAFVRDCAGAMARTTEWGRRLLASVLRPAPAKAKRGQRPRAAKAR